MYRAVELPDAVAGRLYPGSMPGRYEAFEEAWSAIGRPSLADGDPIHRQ